MQNSCEVHWRIVMQHEQFPLLSHFMFDALLLFIILNGDYGSFLHIFLWITFKLSNKNIKN